MMPGSLQDRQNFAAGSKGNFLYPSTARQNCCQAISKKMHALATQSTKENKKGTPKVIPSRKKDKYPEADQLALVYKLPADGLSRDLQQAVKQWQKEHKPGQAHPSGSCAHTAARSCQKPAASQGGQRAIQGPFAPPGRLDPHKSAHSGQLAHPYNAIRTSSSTHIETPIDRFKGPMI